MALDTIVLVRHDATDWNGDQRVQGTINTKLQRGSGARIDSVTDLIVEQVIKEKITFPQEIPIYIRCSDLDRAYNTADRVHVRLHSKHGYKSEFAYTPDLNERHLGELEDKSFEQVLEIMALGSKLKATAENVYPILYLSDEIPGGGATGGSSWKINRFYYATCNSV